MKVFIVGVSGFLGSNLARALEARGHTVMGSSRVPGYAANIRIGDPVDPAVFDDADTIVHCAHDLRPGMLESNVAGARLIFNACSGRHRIFVSSHSARPDAVGEYGISKYRIERFYIGEGETVVRPGLVVGAGGMFGRSLRAIQSARIVPLVDGGRDVVPVLAVSDFSAAMVFLIESPLTKRGSIYNLFNETQPSVREIAEMALRLAAHRALLVSVPYGMASLAVRAAERLGAPLPFDAGSLQALKLSRQSVHRSNLRELLGRESGLEAAIAHALAISA